MAGVQKDQGWAWVVLAASATSLFIFVVLSSSAGFFQVEIMEDLEVGSGPISIMSSLALGQSCMLGPLSGLLASLLSVRVTILLGVILYSGGLLLASFSQSVASVTFSFGFLTGFGFGIAYTATVVVISLHFERHRLLASGIAMCAPGLGTLSLPHAITWGIEEHGWRWTATMMAGFVLHIAVMASVYFPTDTEKQTMVNWSAWWSKLAQQSRDIYAQWNGGHWKDKVVKAETTEACNQDGCKRLASVEHKTEADELNGTGKSKKIADDAENEISSKHKNEEMQMLNISNVDNGGSRSTRKGNEDTEIKSEDLPKDTLKAGDNDTKSIQQNITIVDESDAEAAKIRENLAMNFEEFISREDLRSFKITNRDHILRLGGGSIHEGSLKSLPLTSSTHKDIFECFSSSRLSSPSKQPLNLKDFTKFIQSENIINDYLRIPGVLLNTSVENIEKEESVHQLFRKRSSTSVSDHSYPSLKKDSQLHQSQTASWMYSQTDVMGSSLLLPVRVEEVQAETAESDGDTSVKEKIKM
ncbi:monocarboxylate transporter 12 [Plakobranchus ocellatus]|uniref:Monocarboxylate transporter 12 n=1 Tax=Plakobranchus ocellatus TaxID=259542 RepID=A0AAV3Z176_9GAST|nr:monocarboxylate transporter 12 [Plakobranchus ocellatus]